MDYKWDRIIGSIVWQRIRAAYSLGIDANELKAIGRAAAVKAEMTWRPDGGAALSTHIWTAVHGAVNKAMAQAGRELVEDCEDWGDEAAEDLDSVVLIRESLDYLKARLPSLEWTMLWMRHAEGRWPQEIARELDIDYGVIRMRISRARKNAVTILSNLA